MADILEFDATLNVQKIREGGEEIKSIIDKISKDLGLTVNFEASTESINVLKRSLAELESKTINIISDEQKNAIQELVAALNALTPILEKVEKAATEQSKELLKSVSSTTQIALEEEKVAQAKAKTTAETEKAAAAASRAADAENRRLISAERLAALQAKTSPQKHVVEYEDLAASLNRLEQAAEGVGSAFQQIPAESNLNDLISAINELADDDVSAEIEKASQSFKSYNKTLKSLGDGIIHVNNLQIDLRNAFEQDEIGTKEYDKLNSILSSTAKEYQNVKDAIESIGPPVKNAKEEIEQITVLLDTPAPNKWSNAVLETANKAAEARSTLEGLKKDLNDLSKADVSYDKFIAEQSNLTASIAEAKQEYASLQSTLKNQIIINDELSDSSDAQGDSLNELIAKLKIYKDEIADLSPNTEKFEELRLAIQQTEREVETINRSIGNLALSSRVWGREAVDLTYAIRLLDPSLGILVQRFQRISFFGQLWNKTLLSLAISFNITRKAVIGLLAAAGGLVALFAGPLINHIIKYRQAQREAREEAERFIETIKEGNASIVSEYLQFINLTDRLKKATEGTSEYNSIKRDLIKSTKDLTSDLDDEIAKFEDLDSAIKIVGDRILETFQKSYYDKAVKDVFDNAGKEFTKATDLLYDRIAKEIPNKEIAEALYKDLVEALVKSRGAFTDEVKALLSQFDRVTTYVDQRTGRVHTYTVNNLNSAANQFASIYEGIDSKLAIININQQAISKAIDDSSGAAKEWIKVLRTSGIDDYTDDVIRSFSSTTDVARDLSRRLEDVRRKLVDLRKQASSSNGVISASIDNDIEKATELEKTLLSLIKIFGYLPSSTGGDTRQQELLAEVDVIKQATQAYEKLLEVYSSDEAARKINETYGQLIKNFEKLPSDFELQFDGSDVIRATETALEVGRNYIKKAQALKLRISIQEEDVKNVQKAIKRTIDQINTDIARQQEANRIFQDILGLGISPEIVAEWTLKTTGKSIENIRKVLEESIKEAAEGIHGLEIPLTDIGKVDYAKLEADLDGLGEGYEQQKTAIQNLIKQLRAYDLETFKSIYSGLDKFQSYEEQKTRIVRAETERRRQIREDIDLPEEEKESLVLASQAKQAREIDKLIYDTFKSSDLYVQAFDDLDKVSTASLQHIQQELLRLQGSLNNLDPAQLKELQSRLKEIEGAIIERNPFKGLADDIQVLRNSTISLREAQRIALADLAELTQAEESLRTIEAQIDAQRELIEEFSAGGNAQSEEVQAAKEMLIALQAEYEIQKEITEEVRERAGLSKENADELQKAVDNIAKKTAEIASKTSEWADIGRDAVDAFRDVADLFGGVSEETEQVLNGIVQIIDGLEQAGKGAAELTAGIASGNPVQIISGSIKLIGGIAKTIGGFFDVFDSRTRKANREIKRQQKIIDDLTDAYTRLERAASKAITAQEKVSTSREQQSNILKQINALERQIAAEQSKKKKKRDEDFIKQNQDTIQQLKDQYEDLGESIFESITGTGIESAIQSFTDAWVDAYFAQENTFEALQNNLKDLVRSLAKSLVAQTLVKAYLDPFIKQIEASVDAAGNIDTERIYAAFNGISNGLEDFDEKLQLVFNHPFWENGFDNVSTNLQGLAKSIQSITEDTALALAGDLGSIKFYSVGQYNELIAIHELMESYLISNGGRKGLIDLQNEMLTTQILIRNDVRQISSTAQSILYAIESVIEPGARGSQVKIG